MTYMIVRPYRRSLVPRGAMDRVFEGSFVRPLDTNGRAVLPVDVEARPDEYVVRASVPGLKPEDLRVEVLGDSVTLAGEVRNGDAPDGASYLLQERHHGRRQFSRRLTLPTPLNPSKAEATIEHGVLTLRLPKADEAKPKTISVKIK